MLAGIDHIVRGRLCVPDAGDREITATLRYHAHEPFAAGLVFPASASLNGKEATWTFARALLAAGLWAPTGDGDVQVWPMGPRTLMIELRVPEGSALVGLSTADVRAFLSRAYEVVPTGEEHQHLDVDALLAVLLKSE
jgi:hypothetical protein